MRSRKWYAWAGGATAAGIAGAALLVGVGADAQQAPFEINPPDPAPGETFEVSGTCVVGDEPGVRVNVFLTDFEPVDVTEAEASAIRQAQVVPDQDDFTWSATLDVPAEAEPGATFFVSVACIDGSFSFDTGSFGVGVPQPTTTTTTTTPSTPPGGSGGGGSGAPATPAPAAPPASSVEAEPTVTG